jgi:hypothetical protein
MHATINMGQMLQWVFSHFSTKFQHVFMLSTLIFDVFFVKDWFPMLRILSSDPANDILHVAIFTNLPFHVAHPMLRWEFLYATGVRRLAPITFCSPMLMLPCEISYLHPTADLLPRLQRHPLLALVTAFPKQRVTKLSRVRSKLAIVPFGICNQIYNK